VHTHDTIELNKLYRLLLYTLKCSGLVMISSYIIKLHVKLALLRNINSRALNNKYKYTHTRF
jgi:hypothetical protein